MTPTTSTPHRDPGGSRPGLALASRERPASGPAAPPGNAAPRALPGCRGGRARRGAPRPGRREAGLGLPARRVPVGGWGRRARVGRECPHRRGGRGRALGQKSLSGATSQVGPQPETRTRKPAQGARLSRRTGCGPSRRPPRHSLALPLEAGRGSELGKALEGKGRPRGGIECPRGWGRL